MKLCRSVSPARRSRLPRITAFALASSATRSSAACSRSRRTSSTRRSRCSAAPITPAAVSSAASSEASMARCWRVLSKPTTPMNSPATKIGTIALVWVPTPSMPDAAWPAELSSLLKQTLRPARSSAHTAAKFALIAGAHGRIAQMRRHARRGPLARPRPAAARRCGPVRVSMTFTRSTWAASPISPSTRGIAARTSGASSSRRLALAEAVSSRSRACSDSLMRVSSSAQGCGLGFAARRHWRS